MFSHGSSSTRRKSSSTSKSSKSSKSDRPVPQYTTSVPEDPGLSFIFIVNSLSANEDPSSGGILPRNEGGRWVPPDYSRGFYRQNPGSVFRWDNGRITRLSHYAWHHQHIPANSRNEASNGILADSNGYTLLRYGAATVFYANPFMKFRTAPGDATARDLYQEGEIWHHLRFHHMGAYRNITYVDHAGSEDYVAGASNMCPWHKQLIPQAYETQEDPPRTLSGGLAGRLPLLIALVAFSCTADELDAVLLGDRSWVNRNWVKHDRRTGRRERRGMVVHVYLDPENPSGSTPEALEYFESAEDSRPVFRPEVVYQG